MPLFLYARKILVLIFLLFGGAILITYDGLPNISWLTLFQMTVTIAYSALTTVTLVWVIWILQIVRRSRSGGVSFSKFVKSDKYPEFVQTVRDSLN